MRNDQMILAAFASVHLRPIKGGAISLLVRAEHPLLLHSCARANLHLVSVPVAVPSAESVQYALIAAEGVSP